MTYNSQITITNSTPNRGTVSGKLTRLPGSTGKLYAHPRKGYVFSQWIDINTGNVISTSNPLVITSWSNMDIEAAFGHVMLDAQYYKDRDAQDIETWHVESIGINNRSAFPTAYAPDMRSWSYSNYYSQGQRDWVLERTAQDNTVYKTWATDWGYNYNYNLTPRIGTGTWDGTTTTGTWLRSPQSHDLAPLSGIPAENFLWGRHFVSGGNPEDRRPKQLSPNNRFDWITTPQIIDQSVNTGMNHSHAYVPFYGIRNNPTTGPSTQFPLLHFTNVLAYDTSRSIDPIDTTGMEQVDQLRRVHMNGNAGVYSATGKSLINIDGWLNNTYMRSFAHGYIQWPANRSVVMPQGIAPNPRALEVFNYWPNLQVAMIFPGSYTTGLNYYSGPRDTLTHTNSSSNWVPQYQHTPKSGSMLYNLRYTSVSYMLLRYCCATDMSVFARYGKSLKSIDMKENLYNSQNNAEWPALDFSAGKLKSLKNLRALSISEVNNNATPAITTDWTGLKDLNKLTHLNIVGTAKLTSEIKWSDLPANVKHVYIYPPPNATSNNPFPGEKITACLLPDANGLTNQSRHTITVTNVNVTKEDIT